VHRFGMWFSPAYSFAERVSSRGEQTRERILDTALELFRERGYEATTMRGIASAAGVAVGNSYYYFPSKEHLVQAFYTRIQTAHIEAATPLLQQEKSLRDRLRLHLHERVDGLRPYHSVSGTLFRSAADPESPLSPFSSESGPTRRASVAFMREVIDGSSARIPQDVAPSLPHILWLYEVGIVAFWVHDRSPEQRRTHELIDDSTDAIVRMLSLANLPVLSAARKKMLRWVADLVREDQ
jgi:AcrR family transcriptional regulator